MPEYEVRLGEATSYVQPIDEAGIDNELRELLYLECDTLKKLDAARTHDVLADARWRSTGAIRTSTVTRACA